MADAKALVTADGRFGYEAAGAPDAQALVFLHGIGGAARAWRPQLAAFGDRYRAIAWDMPGYGHSTPLAAVSIASLAGALQDFLAATATKNPIVIGHSIGGMIVQQALAQGAAYAAAVLAQTSPAFGKPDGEWQQTFIAARLGPLDRGATMASLADGLVGELVGEAPDPKGLAIARDCMARVPDASYRAMMLALMGFDLRKALPDIKIPTLVLAGSRDTNAPSSMMTKMAERIPGASYVELAGAGHLANLEQPAAFDAALTTFLERVSP